MNQCRKKKNYATIVPYTHQMAVYCHCCWDTRWNPEKKKKHGKLYVCYVFKQCEGDVTCVVRNKERRRSKNTEEKIHKLLSIRCERMNGAQKIRTKV